MEKLVVFCLLLLTVIVYSDDVFQCCMKGWKQVGDVELCSGPCCDGYHEVTEHSPFMDPVIHCKKNELRAWLLKPTVDWSTKQDLDLSNYWGH